MDIKEIKKIVELMKENQLTEFDLQEEGCHLTLKRNAGGEAAVHAPMPVASPMIMAAPVAAPVAPVAAAPAAAPVEDTSHLTPIKSPMVGTFYRAATPEAEPFVSVGKMVTEETVVCIIEAMKVMNEIKAEVKGVITQVLIENAKPVEFGQPLFKVRPN